MEKTTLLRIIAGLEFADNGHIWFGEKEVTQLSAAERGVGFVFQHLCTISKYDRL